MLFCCGLVVGVGGFLGVVWGGGCCGLVFSLIFLFFLVVRNIYDIRSGMMFNSIYLYKYKC
jgi:hypothetical protein